MKILNLGCGDSSYGDVRVDVMKTKSTTHTFNLNNPWPLKSEEFDEIYCRSVFEHIRNLGTFVDECYRVLKSGGKIWIRTDHAGFILAHILKAHEPNHALQVQYKAGGFGHKGKKKDFEDHHYTLFVESHLRSLFGKFKNHEFNYISESSNKLKTLVLKMLPKNLGAYHIEMTAIKP